jgi:hypothetical protein
MLDLNRNAQIRKYMCTGMLYSVGCVAVAQIYIRAYSFLAYLF